MKIILSVTISSLTGSRYSRPGRYRLFCRAMFVSSTNGLGRDAILNPDNQSGGGSGHMYIF